MNIRRKMAVFAAMAILMAGVGCGGDDDTADGSGEAYVEVCTQHALDCTNIEASEEDTARESCQLAWAGIESQTDNAQACEEGHVEAYNCRIDKLCPADEHEDGDDDPCESEHASAGLACFG